MKVGDLVWVDGEGVGLVIRLHRPYGNGVPALAAVLFPYGECDVCVDECEMMNEAG